VPFRTNYRQQRGDRTRAKEQKKQEKLERREAESARRKAEREAQEQPDQAGAPDEEANGGGLPPAENGTGP
jgi:hypothetical protein